MTSIIILLGLLMVLGIILLSGHSPLKERTREDYLREMEALLASNAEPIQGMENCFRINFAFEGLEYTYEDIEQASFEEKIYKGFLKMKTPSDFTLNFAEKEGQHTIRSELFMVSSLDKHPDEIKNDVNPPKAMKNFKVVTNNTYIANKLLEDSSIVRIFLDFKNVDSRGYSFVSLRILEGLIVLEFYNNSSIKPSLEDLRNNVHSMETYVDRLSYLYKKLDQIIKS